LWFSNWDFAKIAKKFVERVSKANWRFAVEGNLLPTACKCPLWWGAGKPTGAGESSTTLAGQARVFAFGKTIQALR